MIFQESLTKRKTSKGSPWKSRRQPIPSHVELAFLPPQTMMSAHAAGWHDDPTVRLGSSHPWTVDQKGTLVPPTEHKGGTSDVTLLPSTNDFADPALWAACRPPLLQSQDEPPRDTGACIHVGRGGGGQGRGPILSEGADGFTQTVVRVHWSGIRKLPAT